MTNILLITDTERVLRIFESLEKKGAVRLRTAATIDQADQEIAAEVPEVTFVQSRVSGFSGEIHLRHLRKVLPKSAKVVLLSGDAAEAAQAKKDRRPFIDLALDDEALEESAGKALLKTAVAPSRKKGAGGDVAPAAESLPVETEESAAPPSEVTEDSLVEVDFWTPEEDDELASDPAVEEANEAAADSAWDEEEEPEAPPLPDPAVEEAVEVAAVSAPVADEASDAASSFFMPLEEESLSEPAAVAHFDNATPGPVLAEGPSDPFSPAPVGEDAALGAPRAPETADIPGELQELAARLRELAEELPQRSGSDADDVHAEDIPVSERKKRRTSHLAASSATFDPSQSPLSAAEERADLASSVPEGGESHDTTVAPGSPVADEQWPDSFGRGISLADAMADAEKEKRSPLIWVVPLLLVFILVPLLSYTLGKKKVPGVAVPAPEKVLPAGKPLTKGQAVAAKSKIKSKNLPLQASKQAESKDLSWMLATALNALPGVPPSIISPASPPHKARSAASEPHAAAKAQVSQVAKAEGKPPVAATPNAAAKPEAKPVVKPEVKPLAKPEPKPVAKVEPKPVAKAEPKPVAKPQAAPAAKPAVKEAAKPVATQPAKPAVTEAAKPASKTETKPVARAGVKKLPTVVANAEPDGAYGKTHPGWQRFADKSAEYMVFKEGDTYKAIQVIALGKEIVSNQLFKKLLMEFGGVKQFLLQSTVDKGDYVMERGMAGSLSLTIYRKKKDHKVKGLVLYYQ